MAITNGQVADADEVLAMSNIKQVYTSTGFNSSVSGGAATDTQDHELTAVASAPNSNYAIIKITGTHLVNNAGVGGTIYVKLKAQIKETGGAYGDIVGFSGLINGNANMQRTDTITREIVATLTSGQKTNGFQIKVFSSSSTTNSSHICSFTNVQTTQEVRT